jgi:C-terminal processing protease CtpA/Prc
MGMHAMASAQPAGRRPSSHSTPMQSGRALAASGPDYGVQKPQSIVSRSSASDTKQVGPNGSVDGLYGIGAGVSVAEGQGFWINSVKSGGPADMAGVRKGDLLVGIDGRRPSSLGMLRSLLLGPKGTAVDISLQRKDRPDASAPSAPPQWVSVVARVVRGGGVTGAGQGPVLGIGMGFKLSAGGGFIVSNVQPAGPAERAGVQPGDVICTYNGESLSNKPGSFLTGAPSVHTHIRTSHTCMCIHTQMCVCVCVFVYV